MSRRVRKVRAVHCPYCQREIRGGARICPSCRSRLLHTGTAGPGESPPQPARAPGPVRKAAPSPRFGRMAYVLLPLLIVFAALLVVKLLSSGLSFSLDPSLGSLILIPLTLFLLFRVLSRKR